MASYVILLRGINVGGHNKLSMVDLKDMLGRHGFSQVQTYIQSGNVVCAHRSTPPHRLAAKVQQLCRDERDLDVGVWAATADDFLSVLRVNPFKAAEAEPKTLHVFFAQQSLLLNPAQQQALDDLLTPGESFAVAGTALYLNAPDGVGRSRFAASVERTVGMPLTARNWRTVEAVAARLSRAQDQAQDRQ